MKKLLVVFAVAPCAALAQVPDPAMRTTCLTQQYAQEYYDRVTAETVKVIFARILPARAQLGPAQAALQAAQQSFDACAGSCEKEKAALQDARTRHEKARADSDAAHESASTEITAATRRIRAEYAPCPEEKAHE